jgi:KUP system potassium uptake protein
VKYVIFVLRADNDGEGGVLSLMALALRSSKSERLQYRFLLMLGALGACMLLGESVITPAISVLSAVEGLEVVNPGMKRYVIPITLVIIIALFMIQRYGTAAVGRFCVLSTPLTRLLSCLSIHCKPTSLWARWCW